MSNILYYYTPPDYALANLRAGHIKVASFSSCNDPFELAAFNMKSGVTYKKRRLFRKRIRDWQCRQDNNYGLICFSMTRKSPLMWAHYAGEHTGLCLEFMIDQEQIRQSSHALLHVHYTPTRIRRDRVPPDLDSVKTNRLLRDLCATKFSSWRYEKEVRLLVDFGDPNVAVYRNMRFMPIAPFMRLRKIFMGYRSEHYVECIEDALGTRRIPVVQTRPAFANFEIVLQQNKSYWKSRKNN